MATYGDLRTRLRNDILSESDTSFYSDADLLNFLLEASSEIASLGGFPVNDYSVNIAADTTSVGVPSDLVNVEFREVTFKNMQLESVPLRTIRLYQEIDGLTRYYHYDPRGGGDLFLAPAAHAAGRLDISYIENVAASNYDASSEVWGGVLPDWHDAVLYLAAVKAFERGFEYDKAQYWEGRLQRRLQPLSIYLDNNNVMNVASRMESENASR